MKTSTPSATKKDYDPAMMVSGKTKKIMSVKKPKFHCSGLQKPHGVLRKKTMRKKTEFMWQDNLF